MKKIPCDDKLAFEVEKMLIASHPKADFIRVDPYRNGLVTKVEENGRLLDVSAEVTAYVNRMLQE